MFFAVKLSQRVPDHVTRCSGPLREGACGGRHCRCCSWHGQWQGQWCSRARFSTSRCPPAGCSGI